MSYLHLFRKKLPPIYEGQHKLIRVGNGFGVYLPMWWARDNNVAVGDMILVRAEAVAHRKKRLRSARRPAVKPEQDDDLIAQLERMPDTPPVQPQGVVE